MKKAINLKKISQGKKILILLGIVITAVALPATVALVGQQQDTRQFAQNNIAVQQVVPDGDGCTTAIDGNTYCCPSVPNQNVVDCGYTADTSCQQCGFNSCSDPWTVAECSSLGGNPATCDSASDCQVLSPNCIQGKQFTGWSCVPNNQGTAKHCRAQCADIAQTTQSCGDLGGQCVTDAQADDCFKEFTGPNICNQGTATRCCVKQNPDQQNATCPIIDPNQSCTASQVECARNGGVEGEGSCYGSTSFCCRIDAQSLNNSADQDGDGLVSVLDYNLLLACYEKECSALDKIDLNNDDNVDILDLEIFLNQATEKRFAVSSTP